MFSIRDTKPDRTCTKKYQNYRQYKPYLKNDFKRKCGYCGVHHMYFGSGTGFHIDHFAPKSKFPSLECEYGNLVYSCPFCNVAKSDDWKGGTADEKVVNGEGYVDPCDESYDRLFYRDESGRIHPSENDEVAKYMHKQLKFFLKRHEIFWLADYFITVIRSLRSKLETLPEDDPDRIELAQLTDQAINKMLVYNDIQRGI